MKTIIKSFEVFPFIELSEDAQKKAISDHIDFWLQCSAFQYEHYPNFKKACDKAEKMQTPWFVGEYVYEYCKDEIINELEENEYFFTADGELFND